MMTTETATTTPQQDENPRKKLYRALVGSSNEDAKAHFKQFSFDQFNKRLDDEKFVQDLYESIQVNNVVLDPKNRQPEQNYYDFLDAYVKGKPAPAAKPAAPVAEKAKPVEANGKNYDFVGQPQTGEMDAIVVNGKSMAVPKGMTMVPEGEEISEMEYEGQMLPEVTAYGNLPEYGTQEYEQIIKGNYPVGSDEYNLQMAVKNQLPRVELGAGGYGGVLQPAFENKAQIEQETQSPVFRRQKLAEAMMQGEVPVVTQQDVRKAQEGFGRATKERQQAAIMGTPGYNLEKEKEWEKLSGLEKTGQKVMDFASGFNRALFKTPSSVVKTSSELGVGILNMLGGDMKSEDAILYNLADKYDKWLDTSETAKKWIGDPSRGGLVSDVGSGIGQIFTMYATGGTGGASKALLSQPTVLKAVGQKMFSKPSMVSFSQIFNSEYEAMKAKGESDQTAFKQALLNGFTASPLENLPLVNLAERLNKTIGVKLTKRIINSLQQGAEEATQESVQQVFSNLSNNSLVELEKNIVDWARGVQPSAEAGGVVGALIGGLANVRDARKYATSKVGLSTFSPAIQESQVVQIAANDYQKSISRAEEQGKKPYKFDVKQLEKLRNDPEAWVKGEIKYLTQKIEEDKKANIDTKVTEADLAEHNALLAQIKAEKKGMEQAALAPAQKAAPVAPEAEVVPAETVTAPEVTAPVAFPSDEQIADDIQNRRFATFTYSNESEVPEQFKDKISSRGETNGVPFVRVTLPQSVAEYEASRTTPEAPATETAPVTEEAPVAEETIPVAPETEEDYSFLEETELTPEERDALLAQEETAPVAPVEEEVVTEEVPVEPVTETPKAGSVIEGDVETKNEGKADTPTKESVTERLNINNPFYKKVEDALVKLGLIEKYNPETGTGDVVGGYIQQTSDGGFSAGKMVFSQDGSISYLDGDVKVSFDKNGNVISENTKEAKQKAVSLEVESKKESIANLEKTRDSEEFKYKEVTETDPLGNRKKVRRLKTEQELKESTDKINAAIDKAKTELSNLEQSLKETPQAKASAAPMKEVGVGGIIYGHEDIVGNKGLGDVRNQLPEENSGVIVANGKDGNQYAVAFSRKGGDRQNIFEQTPAARPGHIYTSVKIDDPSNAQEVEAAKKQAEAALAEILPTVKGGNIRASAVQQAITDFQTKKPTEPAPAPKAKKTPVLKAETKQETPKTETKKEEAPKTEAKPVSTTPKEGDTVEIPAQRAEFGTRKMVFKEGEWKQNVGGDILKVGPAVQQQAQEAFAGKEETKPAETKREAKVSEKEEYDFSKAFEPLTEEEQKKIDEENLQEEAKEKQRLFDKAGFDKSWAKNYDEAKTKLIDQYNKAKEKKEKAEAKVIKKSGGKSVFVGDEIGGSYVSVDRINEKNRLQDIAIAEKDMAEAVKDLAKLGVKLPSQIKEESVTTTPAPETKEGKKAEAKEEKVMPTSEPQKAAVEIAKAFTDRFGIKVNLIDSKGLQNLLSTSENAKEFFFKVLDKIDVFETDNIQEAKNFITTVFQTVESAEDAKKAYRKLAIKYHPDKRGSEEVMKHLNDVNDKYQKGTLGRGFAQQERPSQAAKEQNYREWAERMSRQYEADARAYAQSSQMGDEQRAREAAKAQAEKQAAEAKAKTTQTTQKEAKAEQPKPKPAQPTSKIKKGIIESLVEFFTKPFGAEKATKGKILTFETRSKYKKDAWDKRNSLKEENRKNELSRINENLKNYTSDKITTKQYRENEAAIRSEYDNKNKAVDDWYKNTVAAIDKAYEKKIPFAYKQYVGNKVAGLYDPVSLQAYVVLDNLDETTYIHEAFSHPFIEAVRERNNELYNNLLAESKNTQEIVDYVDENYGNAPQQVKDAEYIARAIDLDAKGRLKNKTLIEYVKEFWDEANKIFKDIFGGKGVAIENISPTTKVSDIVDFVLTSGEKLTLTKPSTKELASQVEDMRSLPPAKRKAAQQALEERYGKEDVAKMIEITANFTKIIDDLEQRGVVKIDCP